MRYRYTMKELNESTDSELILQCVRDRRSSCTNRYSPLYKRLSKIISNLERTELKRR